jgi:nucleotide-binding universal stress UspA family protein
MPAIEVASAAGPTAPRLARSLSVMVVRDKPYPARIRIAKAHADQAVAFLTKAGIEARGRVLWGDAANAILHKAADAQADLLVAGSRGLSGVWSWLLGSVSRRLVREGRCSVLIVRGPMPVGSQAPSAPSDSPAV